MDFSLLVNVLVLGAVYCVNVCSGYRVSVWTLSGFPVEVGGSVGWEIRIPTELHHKEVFITGVVKAIPVFKCSSRGATEGRRLKDFGCIPNQNNIKLTLTPTVEDYGLTLSVMFYDDANKIWEMNGELIFQTVMHLTRQPTFLNMSLELERDSLHVSIAPPELNLTPPTFLVDSQLQVICKTDGALPPKPVNFSIECPPPTLSMVENNRQKNALSKYPYNTYYRKYGFSAPPNDNDLALYLARRNAENMISDGTQSPSRDNLTFTASIPISAKSHECSIYCRLAGKEKQAKLLVYYPTSLAYLLPAPKKGIMYAGTTVTCHADGYPPPDITLELQRTSRSPSDSGSKPDLSEMLLQRGPSTRDTPTFEELHPLDTSAAATASRVGLRPNQYDIRGATLTLFPNATPGVELLLYCKAGNSLPNSFTFLNQKHTIATARFVVAVLSPSNLGIVLGVSMVILLIAVAIIGVMMCLKRKQNYAANAEQTRIAAGSNGARLKGGPLQKSNDLPDKSGHSLLRNMRSSLTDLGPGATGDRLSTFGGAPINDFGMYDAVCAPERQRPAQTNPHLAGDMNGDGGLEYAVLNFDHMRTSPTKSATGGTSLGRWRRSGGPSTSGATSASMTLCGGGPQYGRPPRTMGASLPHNLDGDGGGDYSEIVAIMQPKAHTNQLVLQQQQEATQTLLALQQTKPSVFV